MAQSGFKVKFYPNGEWTAGYVPPKRLRKEQYPEVAEYKCSETAPIDIYHAAVEMLKQGQNGELTPLDLSIPANSHKRRGLNGITSKGQRLVRNAAYALQVQYGRKTLSFLTLTVPSLGEDVEREICRNWSQITRLFCQRLKRALVRSGLPSSYIGVTEIQPKRWVSRGEVGLHLHLVFVGRHNSRSAWQLVPQEVRSWWLEVLSCCLKRSIQSESCENLQMVKKDASGYLGKYMSKGVGMIEEVIEAKGEDFVPTAWYTCSIGLKRCIKKSIVERWDEDIHLIMKLPLLCQAEIITNVYVNAINIDGREFIVGFGGKFQPSLTKKAGGAIWEARSLSYSRAVNFCDS